MQHKKALIAAAITAGLAVSANAAAEATVYGKIHTSIASVSEDTGTTDTSSTEIKSNASRIGVKGSKELQNGLTVTGQAEFEIDFVGDKTESSQSKYISTRNTYVGLKGGFGEVRVGMHDTPHKMSTAKLDVFSDTYADYNNIIQNDNRLGNVIAYLNNFGNVGFAAAYYAGNDEVDQENTADATSAMVNYAAGDLYLAAAVESFAADNTAATDELETATKFGAGYKFGPVALGLVYETLAYETSNDVTETYVSLKYKASDAVALKAAYGMRDDDVSATDDEVMSAVGVDYKMDKSATLYALYANGTDGGLSHKGKLDGDATALSMGIVYKF